MECSVLRYNSDTDRIETVAHVPYISVVQELCYNDVGKLQAVFPPMEQYMDDSIIAAGRFLTLGANRNLMYIHTIKRTHDGVWAYGYEAKGLFGKMHGETIFGYPIGNADIGETAARIIRGYCNGSFPIGQTNPVRLVWLNTATHSGTSVMGNVASYDRTTLLSFVEECCITANKGYRMVLDDASRKANVEIYNGTTTSYVFSDFVGNLNNSEYKITDAERYGKVYVRGEGDIVVESTGTGLIDGIITSKMVDLSSSFKRVDSMTVAQYRTALTARANDELANSGIKTAFTADINIDGVDVNLGDYVTLRDNKLNATKVAMINKIQYTCEGNSVKIKAGLV